MPYCFIRSINRFAVVVGLFVLCNASAVAQDNNISPYSRYGLGKIIQPSFTHQLSMGGLTLPLVNGYHLNADNPAAWSNLKKPVFDVGFAGQLLTINSQGQSEQGSSSYFRGMAFGFPVSKRWGAGFGLMPYSTVGYDLSFIESNDFADVTYRYHGNGGFKRAYAGTSVKILEKDSSHLSIGVNASYLFGSIEQFRRSEFDASEGFLNTRIQNTLRVSDVLFDVGLQYSGFIDKKKNIRFTAGAHLQAGSDISATQELLAITYELGSFSIDLEKDTIAYTAPEDGSIYLPMNMGYGIGVEFKKQLFVGLQYDQQDWNNFEQRFSDTINGGLSGSQRYVFGMRYQPKRNLNPDATVWNRATYRAGFRYSNNYLQFDDLQLEDRAVSVGIGFLMARQTSSINFGIEFGERGTEDNNLLREQYTNFFIGVSLSPMQRWFVKKQYD